MEHLANLCCANLRLQNKPNKVIVGEDDDHELTQPISSPPAGEETVSRARRLSELPKRLCVGSSTAKSAAPAQSKSDNNLLDLPIELWLEVVEYLSIEDAACLALTTKLTYEMIGKRKEKAVLGKLILSDKTRLAFLRALRRDLNPYLMACGRCHYLHDVPQRSGRFASVLTNNEQRELRKCNEDEKSDKCDEYIHSKFRFGDVQVALELSRRGASVELQDYL